MREGKWKGVWARKGRLELYDMEDRTEMHDLAREQPERLRSMIEQWEQWATKTGVSFPGTHQLLQGVAGIAGPEVGAFGGW